MSFHDPWYFAALPLVFVAAWISRRLRRAALRYPATEGFEAAAQASRIWLQALPGLLRLAALVLIVIGLARPRQGLSQSRVQAQGHDIVLAVDVSKSMLAEDFELNGKRQNRLVVVKEVVKDFIRERKNDRIGLVVFAGRPYTACPMTLDHGWLLAQLDRTQIGMVEDGTAIGAGIASALNRLRNSKAKTRLIILLTDGVNNAGSLSPESAADLAKALGIKMYAIGAGTKGTAPYPAKDLFGRTVYQSVKIEVDDEGLARIAEKTGGRYFRATDSAFLRETYAEIDRLERTHFEQPQYMAYRELYPAFVIPAMLLMLVGVIAQHTRLRVLP